MARKAMSIQIEESLQDTFREKCKSEKLKYSKDNKFAKIYRRKRKNPNSGRKGNWYSTTNTYGLASSKEISAHRQD